MKSVFFILLSSSFFCLHIFAAAVIFTCKRFRHKRFYNYCIFPVFCCISLIPPKAAAQPGQYSQFKNFLSPATPSIIFIKFTRSALYYSLNGRPITNDIAYEASLQPNTYYIKQGSTFRPGSTNFSLTGLAYDNYWYIDESGQISVASRDSKIAGTNTPPENLNSQRRADLEEILDLGIIYLDRKTISWNGNRFTAQPREVNWGTISGHLNDGDGIRPGSLEYGFAGEPDISYKAIYQYDDDTNRPDWIPHFIMIKVTSPHYSPQANALLITNSIQKLIPGSAELNKQGYEYTDFVPKGEVLNIGNFVIYSNGFGKILIGTNFETVSLNGGMVILKSDSIWKVRLVMFGFMALSLIGFGWYAIRYHSTSQNGSNSNLKQK